MGYAVKKDGSGWRAVDSKDDIYQNEKYQEFQPDVIKLNDSLSEIIRLESSITQRRMREAILGIDNGWLADVESKIAALREKL